MNGKKSPKLRRKTGSEIGQGLVLGGVGLEMLIGISSGLCCSTTWSQRVLPPANEYIGPFKDMHRPRRAFGGSLADFHFENTTGSISFKMTIFRMYRIVCGEQGVG